MGSWPVIILVVLLGIALAVALVEGWKTLRDLMNRPD